MVLGGFIIKWCSFLAKISQTKLGDEQIIYTYGFNILSMSVIATILSLFWNWGGICIDVLGYVTFNFHM
jgi:ABC-type Co2+ transport system permease subunit